MTEKTMVKCEKCAGSGLIKHEKRMIGTDSERREDPMDFQTHEACPSCAGGGAIPYSANPKPAERKPGYAADQIGAQAFIDTLHHRV